MLSRFQQLAATFASHVPTANLCEAVVKLDYGVHVAPLQQRQQQQQQQHLQQQQQQQQEELLKYHRLEEEQQQQPSAVCLTAFSAAAWGDSIQHMQMRSYEIASCPEQQQQTACSNSSSNNGQKQLQQHPQQLDQQQTAPGI
ncbi:hypothetical protein ACSSS7_008115 [Eimeria intestinalis]